MMNKTNDTIVYVGYYDVANGETDVVLSATNKMDYIINCFLSLGKKVEIVSASTSKNQKQMKGGVKPLPNGVRLRLFDSLKGGNKIERVIRRWWLRRQLYKYLGKTLSPGEQVVIYHSLGYLNLIKKLKRKNVSVIYEVEEIYSDVIGNKKLRKKEVKILSLADAYIFPTESLNKELNTTEKPYAIIHGTYNVEKKRSEKFFDGRIHCVYAGTFDPRKGGGLAATKAAEFLDNKYHIHILGFGTEHDKRILMNAIQETSKKTNCKITYDGLLSGEEYLRFLQSCHIGLSTQNPEAEFNNTSFPSKVLSYLSNGLRVVSIRIPVLEQSGVGDMLYYYERQIPEEIARAIRAIDTTKEYDGRDRIEELNNTFKTSLEKLINNDFRG